MPIDTIGIGLPQDFTRFTIDYFDSYDDFVNFIEIANQLYGTPALAQANESWKRWVDNDIQSSPITYGMFGKEPKSYDEAMKRDKYVYWSEYTEIKNKAFNEIMKIVRLSSEAEAMQPKMVFNDRQIGEFNYDRASMSLKPAIYFYSPSQKREIDLSKDFIYTKDDVIYLKSKINILKDKLKIEEEKDNKWMEKAKKQGIKEESPYKLSIETTKKEIAEAQSSDDEKSDTLVIKVFKVTKADDTIEYVEIKNEDSLKEANAIGRLSVTSSNKKVYLYKEKKPKINPAVKVVVCAYRGGWTGWTNDFYTGIAGVLMVEVLEALGYSVELVGVFGGGRCPRCGMKLNFDGVRDIGRRYTIIKFKDFNDQTDLENLLYTLSDPSFHAVKWMNNFNSILNLYGDDLDMNSGRPDRVWHGIEMPDLVNPIGAFSKDMEYRRGNKNLLDFTIHKIGSAEDIVMEVSNAAIECERINKEALEKYTQHAYKFS